MKRRGPSDGNVTARGNVESHSPIIDILRDESYVPKLSVALRALLVVRLLAAVVTYVTDCDETFNYWEPMHWLVRPEGQSFQTWEYSPQYALRSYAYLVPHALVAKLVSFLVDDEHLIFYGVRCAIGLSCALCEAALYTSLVQRMNRTIGVFFLVFQLFSPGMFFAGSSFLPSSFTIGTTALLVAFQLRQRPSMAIFAVAIAALVAWPFAAAVGLPLALDQLIVRRRFFFFVRTCFIALLVIAIPLIAIDSFFYNRFTIAPLNIVLYNVFSPNGPDLYGTAPLSFYLLNGLLNYNVVFPLALFAPFSVLLLVLAARAPYEVVMLHTFHMTSHRLLVLLTPLFVWIAIFFHQPHKEERFLYTVYPLFSLVGAVSLYALDRTAALLLYRRSAHHSDDGAAKERTIARVNGLAAYISWACVAVFVVLSLSRTSALVENYRAPLNVYDHFARTTLPTHTLSPDSPLTLCVGREWHRFPSSFFLPNDASVQLSFVESEFRAQLPQPFLKGRSASHVVRLNFNDENREERDRYTPLEDCDYLVDVDRTRTTALEPRYAADTAQWERVFAASFLDPEATPALHRALYVPFLRSQQARFVDYVLLKNKKRAL